MQRPNDLRQYISTGVVVGAAVIGSAIMLKNTVGTFDLPAIVDTAKHGLNAIKTAIPVDPIYANMAMNTEGESASTSNASQDQDLDAGLGTITAIGVATILRKIKNSRNARRSTLE